ncbi:hypothetical protein ACFQZI_06450 [Mucilaginibacter lutimaris]|uniref:PLAT domain-containing protein n=1 Tax=Mucilaginibacter lutimaris TaxID=931629 RepID=A0ABW2ZE61_9SPHI
MRILNSEHRTWYLEAININDQSNTLWLAFRQDSLYAITRDPDKNRYYYKNVLLLLWFNDYSTAERYFKLLKDLYLNHVISVDENTPNVIEFVNGNDINVEVVKYEESVIDQSIEDWVNRYLWVSKFYFDESANNELESNFTKDIEILLKNYKKDNPNYKDNRLYQAISEKLKEHRSPMRNITTDDLLFSMNRQLYVINEKLDSINKSE